MTALPMKRLGDLVLEAKPGFACGEETEDGIFQIRMNNITRDGHLDLSKRRLVPAQRAQVADFLLREGDVLFNATNSPDMVGKTALITATDEPTVFSNHFLRLRVDPSVLLPAYLSRWLLLQFERGTFKAMCRQWVNQATVGRDALLRLAVPLPSLAEQRRIAEVLDRAGELRAKRREALAYLDDLTQSIFLDMFGDPALNPLGLPRTPIGELIVLGPQNGLYKPSSEYGEGTPIVRIDAFYDGVITGLTNLKRLRTDQSEIERYGLAERDILINRVNSLEYLGKSAVVPRLEEPTVFESNMMRLRLDPRRADANYVIQLLQSRHIKLQIRASAKNAVNQSSINQTDVKTLDIILPPLAAQREFVRRADAVQQHRRKLLVGQAEFDALAASLRDRAFRGLL
ncbi:restriction endonuclease subunit S [Micromonospora tulbaghiae]|uniref:restriction endonuclease subunit S n=1 Tax=Micromonospora tulbaghiae TaxID=479978 RepID=UPI0033AF3CD5